MNMFTFANEIASRLALVRRAWTAVFAALSMNWASPVWALEGVCVRDAYMKPSVADACDPLYSSGADGLACVQRDCPQETLPRARGLCVTRGSGVASQALAQEALRVAVDLVHAHTAAAGNVASAVAEARARGQAANISTNALQAEQAAMQSLERAWEDLTPAYSASNTAARRELADRIGASFSAAKRELFTQKTLRVTSQAELWPVRSPACGDPQRRAFTSAKAAPVQPSTAQTLALHSGARQGFVWRARGDADACVGIRPGSVGYLGVGPCAPLSAANHLGQQGGAGPLLAHGATFPQCARVDANGLLYISRCESGAPVPNWTVQGQQSVAGATLFQVKLSASGPQQCVSTTKSDSRLRLAPCASGADAFYQLWAISAFNL